MPADLEPPFKGDSPSVPKLIAGALIHRGELAALEWGEARAHGAVTALYAGLTSVFFLLAGMAGTFAIAAAVWERSDRGSILFGLALAYVCLSAWAGWAAYRRLRAWVPFAETRNVLHQDCASIRDMVGHKDE